MLTQAQIKAMRKGGLTDFEIGIINENLRERPQNIDITNEAWQAYFRSRLEYMTTMHKQGFSWKAIHAKIITFLQRQLGTPWDFLRDAYPIKGRKRKDFDTRYKAHMNAKAASRAKVREHFGRAY